MTKEALFLNFDEVDAEMVADAGAAAEKKKSPVWLRWGAAAACLCFLAAGGLLLKERFQPVRVGGGGGNVGGTDIVSPGGSWPEGVDPIIASIAVYPATEKVEDVADATMRDISESEARAVAGLGELLPTALPEGYVYDRGSLYETVMNNGSRYHRLLLTYRRGPVDPGDGNTAPVPGDCFYLFLTDFEPRTDNRIYVYAPIGEETINLTQMLPTVSDKHTFHLKCGDCYVGVEPLSLTETEVNQLLGNLLRYYYFVEIVD